MGAFTGLSCLFTASYLLFPCVWALSLLTVKGNFFLN